MLSHPFVGPPKAGAAAGAESPSENIAILGFPDLVFGALPTPDEERCACGAGLGADAEEKGSILAASAGRTAGRAGEDGPSVPRRSNRIWNSLNLRSRRSVGLASRSMPSL